MTNGDFESSSSLLSATRKRPPELLGLSGMTHENATLPATPAAATSTGLATPSASRLRSISTIETRPEAKRKLSSSRNNHKKKAKALPFLTRTQIQLESSAKEANLALEKQLRRHGRYISRHPIRTLLVACLIITSLFYPAAGIYLWASKGGPGVTRGDARSVWRSLSTPLLDSFASSGRKHHNSLRDLRMIWDDAPDLVAVDARDADYHQGSITPFNLFPNSWPAESTKVEEEKCQSVRVEHVFVTTDDIMRGTGSRHGALDIPILQSALSLQGAIEDRLTPDQNGPRCVYASGSTDCLTLSPLSFWRQERNQVGDDSSPTSTLLHSQLNITSQGIPINLMTTLAGRGHLFSHLPRADHLVLTFFLQDDEDCRQQTKTDMNEGLSKSHEAWLGILRDITGGQVGMLNSEITATKEVVLQFVPKQFNSKFVTQRLLLASAYIAVFIWLCRGLIKIQNVHSRFGLAFTALLELIISMTLAVSICALCGVRLTLVPWEVLPFVVVVIGSESMFVLTNAIISTPIALSVPTRVATGLAKVGVPIAITVMSDVILMSAIMMLVDVRAVREFCIFAIFALFVDFFMQMTFFSTVLSIDLQRLELADLLSQGGSNEVNGISLSNIADNESVASDPSMNADDYNQIPRRKATAKSTAAIGGSLIKLSCRAIWRARTARTASLSLLLAFMFGIYVYHGSGYTSQHSYPFLVDNNTSPQSVQAPPASTQNSYEGARFDPFSHLSQDAAGDPPSLPVPWWHNSPSASFWQALNPLDAPSVRVKVEPWTVLSLRSTKVFEGEPNRSVAHFASWAIFRPRVRAFIWFFKLVVLPISGTTGLLYVLLLYLLKDTELLDAQLNKSEGVGLEDEDEEVEKPKEVDSKNDLDINLRSSSTSHTSDIILVRQSGGYIVSLAIDSSLSVWRPSKRVQKSKTILLSAIMIDYSRITALEIDIDSDLIAVGHVKGCVTLWTLSTLQLIETSRAHIKQNGIVEATAAEAEASSSTPSTQVQSLFILPSLQDRYAVLSAHRDGSIRKWSKGSQVQMLAPQPEALWFAFSPNSSEGNCRNIIALSSSDHRFQLYHISVQLDNLSSLLKTHASTSVVRCATLSTLSLSEDESNRAATWATAIVGTSRGSVVVYDLSNGSNSGQYDILDGPITSIRAIDVSSACPSLGNATIRDVLLANSTTQATVLALSSSSDTSPAALSPTRSPHRRKNGNPLGSPTGSASAREKLTAEGLSPRQPSFSHTNGNGNGFGNSNSNGSSNGNGIKEAEVPAITFSLGIPNGIKARRLSSYRVNHEDVSLPAQSSSLESSSYPTIGSANSSILGHFDGDPFDLNVTSTLHWARLASIECIRGGSDLVMGIDGAKVLGVRRRMRQNNVFALDSRWEAFQLDVDILFSDQLSKFSLETSFVKRCRLDIEDSVLFDQIGEGVIADFPLPSAQRSVHFSPPSRTTASLLSFTRLGHVEASYKERGTKKKKRTIIFAFANCVAAVLFYPPPPLSSSSLSSSSAPK